MNIVLAREREMRERYERGEGWVDIDGVGEVK